jgi:hypothetical protein
MTLGNINILQYHCKFVSISVLNNYIYFEDSSSDQYITIIEGGKKTAAQASAYLCQFSHENRMVHCVLEVTGTRGS